MIYLQNYSILEQEHINQYKMRLKENEPLIAYVNENTRLTDDLKE